jgi:C4-dicarboxylate transporter DctM subunit
MARTLWLLKWELLIPVILGRPRHGPRVDRRERGLTAVYTLVIEVFVYKDLSLKKDLPRITKAAMSMAGAIIIILAMANALMNFVVDQRIPTADPRLHARRRHRGAL